MNKKLLALAIAGVFAAPLAAQAEVSIYGVAHLSVDSLDNDGEGLDQVDGEFISSNSTRIGFKGAEDLGGGLKAIWQVESDVSLDEGGGEFASRNSFVGLAGGFGAVLAGRHDTPMKLVGRKVDLFGDQIGDSRNLIGAGGAGWDLRPDNVIAYASPNMNGLQVLAAYVTGPNNVAADFVDDAEALDDTEAYSVNVTYSNGPLWVGAAYENHNLEGVGREIGLAIEDETGWRLGASYEMGAFKVTALYQSLSDLLGVSGADGSTWGLGAAFAFGNNVVKAQWYTVDNDVAGLPTGGEGEADMWAVGLDHNFSKSTTGYIAYAQTSNDGAAAFGVTGGGHGDNIGVVPGGDATGISLGVIHKF